MNRREVMAGLAALAAFGAVREAAAEGVGVSDTLRDDIDAEKGNREAEVLALFRDFNATKRKAFLRSLERLVAKEPMRTVMLDFYVACGMPHEEASRLVGIVQAQHPGAPW